MSTRLCHNLHHNQAQIMASYEAYRRSCFLWSFETRPRPVPVDISAIQVDFENPKPLCEISDEMRKRTEIVIESDDDDIPMPVAEVHSPGDELMLLRAKANDLSNRIAEMLKAEPCDKAAISTMRAERKALWRELELAETAQVMAEQPKIEVVMDTESTIAEINRTYFHNRKLSQEVVDAIKQIVESRDKDVFINWPVDEAEFKYVALIAGIAVQGVSMILSPRPAALRTEIESKETLFPQSKFVYAQDKITEKPAIMFVFDCHCVSKISCYWIPEYQELVTSAIDTFESVQKVLFSSIASKNVEFDLSQIMLTHFAVLRGTFNLPNVFIEARTRDRPDCVLTWIHNYDLARSRGIIFCPKAYECERVSLMLNGNQICSAFYHEKMNEDQKYEVMASWQNRTIQVIITTNGLISTEPVDYVLFNGLPYNLESLFLQIRFSKRCAILFNQIDKVIMKHGTADIPVKSTDFPVILEFVENETSCRKQLLCSHFGENLKSRCRDKCDNCARKRAETVLHIITDCRLEELVQQLTQAKPDCATESTISGILCGTDSTLQDDAELLPWFATLAKEDKISVSDALSTLENNGALHAVEVHNRYGKLKFYTV